MMVVVFAAMLLAFVFGRFGPRWMAVTMLAACLILSIYLFLFEVYSSEYGFRMPWIQTELDVGSHRARES
jgi:hypothetical protein